MDDITQSITTYFYRVRNYNPLVIAVQLLLIGAVVWVVLRFLRGTRGAGMLKGATVLIAVIYVGIGLLPKTDQWRRIEFLYGRFLFVAFVSLMVAFQPELRRALIRLGQAGFLRAHKGRIEATAEALADSAAYLSRNRIGAVVAVERAVGLGALMQTGTIINSRLTAELLNTIFYPGSALHDMGVIVRDGQIAAAGCQFPLAESGEVDSSLGSRHRAALGLALDSDAVVMVVSEQTGRVSLAYDGQLYIGMQVETLRDTLVSLLTPRPAKRKAPAAKAEES